MSPIAVEQRRTFQQPTTFTAVVGNDDAPSRTESDAFGEIQVAADKYWGAVCINWQSKVRC